MNTIVPLDQEKRCDSYNGVEMTGLEPVTPACKLERGDRRELV